MKSPEARRTIHVGAIVLNGSRVLFVRQTPSHSLGPVWTIPWGVLDPDESPSCAARREVLEEAGITARVTGLLAVQPLPEPWAGTIAIVFLCNHASGTPTPDGVETDQARYLAASDLSGVGAIEPWCCWLVERVLAGHTDGLLSVDGNPFGSEGFIAQAV